MSATSLISYSQADSEQENICRLIEWFEDPQHICLVLEYIDGGDLLDYVMSWPSDQGGLRKPLPFQVQPSLTDCSGGSGSHLDSADMPCHGLYGELAEVQSISRLIMCIARIWRDAPRPQA